jgi:hypothetical protein
MHAVIHYGSTEVATDFADALSLAVPLDFDGPQPNAFGLRHATARAVETADFVGDTRRGGAINCEELSLTPHGNGTHTECIGHLTTERIAVSEVLHGGLFLAALVTVRPTPAVAQDPYPAPPPGDRWITRQALSTALEELWPTPAARPPLSGLIVRTLPNDADKLTRTYPVEPSPAYFSADAVDFLVENGIDHLVTDLPSLDRSVDGGALVAHRRFWGMSEASRLAGGGARHHATITELAFIAPTVRDGLYVMNLQVPAFLTDAVPSRPLVYPARLR